MDYIRRIDAMGGTLRAIETGFIQREIQNAAFEFQREMESGRRIVVGVNRFQMEERAAPVFRIDPAIERSQVEACGNCARREASRGGEVSRRWSRGARRTT